MFSISFGEMAIIVLLLVLVVGPKRLPEMARFCGHLLGRLNRQVRDMKREIKREMDIEDLRQIKRETEEAVKDIDAGVKNVSGAAATVAKPVGETKHKPAVADERNDGPSSATGVKTADG